MPMADGASRSSALILHSLKLGEKLSDDEIKAVMQDPFVLRGFHAQANTAISSLLTCRTRRA